jgi:hypothetical protein
MSSSSIPDDGQEGNQNVSLERAAFCEFQKHTDLQPWRPKIFQNVYDKYFERVGNDIGQIFSTAFQCTYTSFLATERPISQKVILAVISPLIAIPIAFLGMAFAIPFIGIRHITLALIPAIAFDCTLKLLLTGSFLVQNPASAFQVFIASFKKIFRKRVPADRQPGSNQSSEN